MAITTALCTSFKQEILEAVHNFKNSGGSTFNLALYTSSASLGAGTTAYTTSNEVSGTNYTAKGASLTRVDPSTSGTTALTDFADLTFSNATVTARGALIFNDSASGDPAVCALDFGGDKTTFGLDELGQTGGVKNYAYIVARMFWENDSLIRWYKSQRNRKYGFSSDCAPMAYLLSQTDEFLKKEVTRLVA